MSDTFTSTVDGTTATFDTLYQEGRQVTSEAAVSVRLLPYGPPPNAVIQSAGGMPERRTFKLLFTSQGEVANLTHCRGHHGTLATTELGSFDCTLVSTKSSWIAPDLQTQEVDAEFVADNV